MGGCCCCCVSRNAEHNNLPPVCQFPRSLEGGPPLSCVNGSVPVLSTWLIVNTNFDTANPQTNTLPHVPVPVLYDPPQTLSDVQQPADANSGRTEEEKSEDTKSELNALHNIGICFVDDLADVLDKCGELKKPCEPFDMEEEDVCPTCLEEYDVENPKIITKCQHHFHLACILEWMERSNTCPMCNKEMAFNTGNES